MSTLCEFTDNNLNNPLEIKERDQFNVGITAKLGPSATSTDFSKEALDVETPHNLLYGDDCGSSFNPTLDGKETEDVCYDQYINADVLLSSQGNYTTGKVFQRKTDRNGHEKGRAHSKSTADTREYVIEFPDGTKAEYLANIIAQNMYTPCDLDGNHCLLTKCKVDHKKTAVLYI